MYSMPWSGSFEDRFGSLPSFPTVATNRLEDLHEERLRKREMALGAEIRRGVRQDYIQRFKFRAALVSIAVGVLVAGGVGFWLAYVGAQLGVILGVAAFFSIASAALSYIGAHVCCSPNPEQPTHSPKCCHVVFSCCSGQDSSSHAGATGPLLGNNGSSAD